MLGKIIHSSSLLLLLGSLLISTTRVSLAQKESPVPQFPLALYFGIESGGIDSLNLKITIDGIVVADKFFSDIIRTQSRSTKSAKTTYTASSTHKYWKFELPLPDGTHQITATSSNGDAGLDVVFELHKPLWLVLSYWGKNHLQLDISERRVGFQ